MKILKLIGCIAASLTVISSTFAQESVAVEGKVIETASKAPIGAFTVKAYQNETPTTPSASASPAIRPLAQTLTRTDGSYSLKIPTALKTVILQFEKLSYFSVPPRQIVTLPLKPPFLMWLLLNTATVERYPRTMSSMHSRFGMTVSTR